MKKRTKRLWALLGALLIMFTSALTSLVNAVDLNTAWITFIMPDHDVNLVAISEANGYTIVFNGNWNTNSGTTMADLSMIYDQSKILTTNAYTKVWYTFLWWSTDSSATTATYTDWQEVTNLATEWSITLYAIWQANTYQVVFNSNPDEDTLNVATWTMSNQEFTYDTTWALSSNKFIRTWYTFLWWSTDSSATTATYIDWQEVTNLATEWSITLYAIWQANTDTTYTVNHYLMQLDWTYPAEPTYSGEFTATTYEVVSPTPRSDDWFTLSWSDQTWHVKWDGSTVFNYYYSRNDYTVTLREWRWIESVSGDWSYKFNASVTVSAVLKPWYQDLEWTWTYDTATFNMPASNVDMTANATPTTYTITLNVWSGTISWQPTEYNVEDTVTIPDPTRVWYDFVWRSGTNLNTPTSWLTISPQTWHENLVYEAIWSPRSDITFVVHHYQKVLWEDRYVEESSVTYNTWTADETLTLADFQKTIDCMSYAWWSLVLSASWLSSAISTTTVLPDGSRHIYLYYTRNTHSVTLTRDGNIASVTLDGTTNENTVTKQFECGATVEINAEPKIWYHFLRWNDEWPDFLNPTNP